MLCKHACHKACCFRRCYRSRCRHYLVKRLLKQQVYGDHACSTPAESAGDGDELYGYVCRLPMHNLESTIVEPALEALEVRALDNCGWEGGKHGHTTHPHQLLIQQVFCKHDCHTPAVAVGIVKVSAGAIVTISRTPQIIHDPPFCAAASPPTVL